MRHPPEGVLRRLLDEPDGVADTDRDHVAGCEGCGRVQVAARDDADLVHAALALPAGSAVDGGGGDALDAAGAADNGEDAVDTAWARLTRAAASASSSTTPAAATTSAPSPRRLRVAAPPSAGRVRSALRRPVVAGAAVAVVLAGASAAAANDWLQIFRTERVVPVGLTAADLNAVPDLGAYGEVELTGDADVHEVADAETAEAESGLDVPEATNLPRGVDGEPTYRVGGQVSVTFTFSEERAARTAAEAGEDLPPPPPGADGSRVRLVAGPGVATAWRGSTGGPDLVVGRAVAPQAFSSSGVPFEALRDYLLSLPGLPAEVAAPLRTFNAEGSTLPVPVPADHVTTSSAPVDGVDATVVASRDRSVAVVVWVKDGLLTVVAGPLDVDEVLAVARSLR